MCSVFSISINVVLMIIVSLIEMAISYDPQAYKNTLHEKDVYSKQITQVKLNVS